MFLPSCCSCPCSISDMLAYFGASGIVMLPNYFSFGIMECHRRSHAFRVEQALYCSQQYTPCEGSLQPLKLAPGSCHHLAFTSQFNQGCGHVLNASCLQGLVRSIGVSNFSVKKLKAILSYAEIPPAVCQARLAMQCIEMPATYSTNHCILLSARKAYAPEMHLQSVCRKVCRSHV